MKAMKKLVYIISYDGMNWMVTMSRKRAEEQMAKIRERLLNGGKLNCAIMGLTAEDAISEEDNKYLPIGWGKQKNCEYVMRFKVNSEEWNDGWYIVRCEQHVLNANILK